jgi:membrane-associated protease RseP (regulator of RpoE activity)
MMMIIIIIIIIIIWILLARFRPFLYACPSVSLRLLLDSSEVTG